MKFASKLAAGAAALAASLSAAQASHAAIIDWTLSDGTFDDGGTFSGTFTFNSDTDTITQWNVATTLGGGSPAAFYSSPGGCVVIFCSSADDNGSGPTFANSVFFFGSTFELTNIPMGAPGTVDHLTGDEGGLGFSIFGPFAFSHVVTDGQAVGVLSAAPEPAAWTMMIGGLALAGASLRRRRALATA